MHIDGAQARCVSLTLKDYIGIAYRIKLYQISGPDWIGSDRFDISATLPAGAPISQFTEMMRRLIEERFQIKMHREKKDFPVYVLEVAKGGLKMQESAPDPDATWTQGSRECHRAAARPRAFPSIWGEDLPIPSRITSSRPRDST